MKYLQKLDLDQPITGNKAAVQPLLFAEQAAGQYSVACIRTPLGGGSIEGLHSHPFEQIYYLISGTINLEIDGETFLAEPETLVVFPAGVRHRNWNASPADTVHLSIQIGNHGALANPTPGR